MLATLIEEGAIVPDLLAFAQARALGKCAGAPNGVVIAGLRT